MIAIGNDCVLPTTRAGNGRQPRREHLHRNGVWIAGIGGRDANRQDRRVEFGMPNDTRIGCGASRILGESEAPSGPPRRRGWPCSPGHARPHKRNRGEAIPTSARCDRPAQVQHRLQRRASPASCRAPRSTSHGNPCGHSRRRLIPSARPICCCRSTVLLAGGRREDPPVGPRQGERAAAGMTGA